MSKFIELEYDDYNGIAKMYITRKVTINIDNISEIYSDSRQIVMASGNSINVTEDGWSKLNQTIRYEEKAKRIADFCKSLPKPNHPGTIPSV